VSVVSTEPSSDDATSVDAHTAPASGHSESETAQLLVRGAM
jgi:hypothetical protein